MKIGIMIVLGTVTLGGAFAGAEESRSPPPPPRATCPVEPVESPPLRTLPDEPKQPVWQEGEEVKTIPIHPLPRLRPPSVEENEPAN